LRLGSHRARGGRGANAVYRIRGGGGRIVLSRSVPAFALADGGAIYTWDNGRSSVPVPDTPVTNTSYVGTVPVTTTSWSGGYTENLACIVQIVTDKGRKIVEIRATKDSLGMWQLSRCAEVFGSGQ